MARIDAIRDKVQKLGRKQKLDALMKYSNDSDEAVRTEAAIAIGMISSYEAGMALIPLLRDSSPMVRAAAATSAADINAKHCEEYVKKLAFTETDPNVKQVARRVFDQLKDRVA